MVGVAALAIAGGPAMVRAQQAPQPSEGASAQSAAVQRLGAQLRTAIQAGNIETISQLFAKDSAANPAATRYLAQILGEAGAAKGGDFLARVTERTSDRLVASAATSAAAGAKAIAAIQEFSAGMVVGATKGLGNDAAAATSVVQAVMSATLTGAAKTEGQLGQMARAVASGAVQALAAGGTGIQIASIADVVRQGISAGSVKVAGAGVIVNVVATDNKPVDDVLLTRANGKKIDPGKEVYFPQFDRPNPNDGDKQKPPVSSPS
jgi:hypothetical protein